MANPRITAKEWGLIKGALRRIFSRSELRRSVMLTVKIDHYDASRPRVKNWSLCPKCNKKTPTYQMELDHKEPLIPIENVFAEMSLDVVVDRLWCHNNNLEPLCVVCHNLKTSQERTLRAKSKANRATKKFGNKRKASKKER